MLDEILFMEMRIFSAFLQKHKMKPKEANKLFEEYGIWDYIEECYDSLHTSGDEYILNDIEYILQKRGALTTGGTSA